MNTTVKCNARDPLLRMRGKIVSKKKIDNFALQAVYKQTWLFLAPEPLLSYLKALITWEWN